MVFCTGCAGCACVELGYELCALCEVYCSTQCTQLAAQLHITTDSTTSAEHHMQLYSVLFPEDRHNDARNMLR